MSHAVNLLDVLTHKDAPSVMPWARADAVASIDGVRALRAEVGAPGAVAAIRFGGEPLTVRVGSSQTTQIAPLAGSLTREEEGHRRVLGSILGEGQR